MANGKSDYKTRLDAAASARVSGVSWMDRESGVHYLRDIVNILGNEASGAYHDLGPVGLPCEFVPELSRIRYGLNLAAGAGTLNTTVQLVKVFGATSAKQVTATYARSTTVMTVTTTEKHGFYANQVIYISATGDAATIANGAATVATVTGDYTFTITVTDAGAASGSITLGTIAGSLLNMTAALTCDGSAAEQFAVFAATTHNALVPLAADDTLRLYLPTVTTVTLGRRLLLEIGTLRRPV